MLPVTPTITRGCPAKIANMTAANTLESNTSLTPKLLFVSRNMSSAKAIAGNKLFKVKFQRLIWRGTS